MLALTLLVVSIAAADSINPSTVVPALYLASRPGARGLASFTAGVFAVYLAGGVILVLGPGPAAIAALRSVGPQVEHVTEAAVGVVLVATALVLWRRRRRPVTGERPQRARMRSPASAFALGAGISAVELPTAFMYFGAVSAILDSSAGIGAQLSLVVVYNALFVLPLLLILIVRLVAGEAGEARLGATGAWLRRTAPLALALVAAVAGTALLGVGTTGILAG
jgi:cytochrome c biogenesis protein CcdA